MSDKEFHTLLKNFLIACAVINIALVFKFGLGVLILSITFLVLFGPFLFCLILFIYREKKIKQMTTEERRDYLLGPVNKLLVCPHCQTTGEVRVTMVNREIVSTGTVGGILKTKLATTTLKSVTQHHCDHCGSTWDI